MRKAKLVRPTDIDRLPARFKDYIANMESTIRTLEGQVPARQAVKGARLKVVDALYQGNDGFLPDDTKFEFLINGMEYRVQAAREMAGIEVSGLLQALVVHPRVSNVVVVGTAPR